MTVVTFVSVVVLIVAFFFKAQCLQPSDGRQLYQRLCYSDLPPLYGLRGMAENVFPYVNGGLVDGSLFGGAIEYPVLTGLFMWLTGLPVNDGNQFFVVSAILLTPAALATAYLLGRMTGRRALMWAAAPALVLYAFHNWDLLVVACAVAGVWWWSRRRPVAAALWFGLGAAFKLYPAFFLAPLFFDELRRNGFRRALGSVAAGVGAFAAVNLPFFLAGREGWLATYRFHQLRGPNFDNVWALWFPSDTWLGDYGAITPERLNLVTGVLTGVFFLGALGFGWWRARRDETYPFLQVCAALLAAFLLWSKVHSPQYALWILPFFALLRLNVVWWALYAIADAATYYGIFQWFYDQSLGRDFTAAKKAMIAGVWGRAVLLLLLFGLFLRSRPAVPEFLSHPPANVPPTQGDAGLVTKGGATIHA
ncbi:MAG TPA: glycosyltransferase 87 family protein [Actinomycetota bacterium]|nr:glycosyltransferase 87 family protein [Actinomycetota bacterium]